MNVLLISLCQYKLHEEEFIRPIQQIIEKEKIPYSYKHISAISTMKENEINKFSHIIFSGTALKDFSYFNYTISPFLSTIHQLKISTFAICAGAQVICNYFNLNVTNQLLINTIYTYSLNSSKELDIEKDSYHQIYAIHSYVLEQQEINTFQNKFTNITTTPILYQDNMNIIELLKIDNFTLSFFHPEIKNKNYIINWLYN